MCESICVWDVNGKEVMIYGQRPAGFVCVQVHMDNQQTTGKMLGKGSCPLPQSSTLVWFPRVMSVLITNGAGTVTTPNWDWSIGTN